MSSMDGKKHAGGVPFELLNHIPQRMHQSTAHHRLPFPKADGDFSANGLTSDDTQSDLFTDTENEVVHKPRMNKEGKVISLDPEMSLSQLGYYTNEEIDWKKIHLPNKTDLHSLLHYRISNYLCPDVLIKIGNHEYRCHLLVLQCYSNYFVEKPVSRCEISEEHVTKKAFTFVYDWMLHVELDSYKLLTRDNILEVFMAAQYLGVKELEEQCWAFIDNEELFSEDKAFLLYMDARKHGNPSVMELMVPRIQKFFLILVSSKEFLELVVEEVVVFLRSNYICVHSEMEVFMSGVRWLIHDWEKRSKNLVDVMRCVRFGLIPPWQLVDIRRNPESKEFLLVTKHEEVAKMVEEGLSYSIIKYWYGHETDEYSQWLDMLGLAEPPERNWTGTDQVFRYEKYVFYRDFLVDLSHYRKINKLEKKRSACDAAIPNITSGVNSNPSNETSTVPPPLSLRKQQLDLSELMLRRDHNITSGRNY